MDSNLHMVCISCGRVHSEIPIPEKNCKRCTEIFRSGIENDICRKIGCNERVLDPKYPMCLKHYKEAVALDKKMVKEYFDWRCK